MTRTEGSGEIHCGPETNLYPNPLRANYKPVYTSQRNGNYQEKVKDIAAN